MSYDVAKIMHQAAVTSFRPLCKAEGDIPEVEAAIALVLGRLGRFWEIEVEVAVAEILGKLRRQEDRLPTASVDFIANGEREDGTPALFIAALLGALERRLSAPLSKGGQEALRGLADAILRAGGEGRIDWALPSAAALLEAAEADLMLLVRGRLITRLGVVEGHLQVYLTTRASEETWQRDLEDILGLHTTDWLPATVDAWAYRWHNIAQVVAYHQAGVRTLVLWNPMDKNTTTFCRWAHGREISTALAMERINRYQQAAIDGDIDKVERLWPLKTYDGKNRSTRLVTNAIPPFHFRCRTQVRAKKGEDVR